MFNFQSPKNVQFSNFQSASDPARFRNRFAITCLGFARRVKETIFGKWSKRSNATPLPLATVDALQRGDFPRLLQSSAKRTWFLLLPCDRCLFCFGSPS